MRTSVECRVSRVEGLIPSPESQWRGRGNFQPSTLNLEQADHGTRNAKHAFSLIEILVVVALMTIIILGLLLMFLQTQRAFTSSMTQSDVLAAGRAVMDLIPRELEQMTPSQIPSFRLAQNGPEYRCTNFFSQVSSEFYPPLLQGLPGNSRPRTNIVKNLFFLSRNNQDWIATGYAVIPTYRGAGLGALYRFVSVTNTMRSEEHTSELQSHSFISYAV